MLKKIHQYPRPFLFRLVNTLGKNVHFYPKITVENILHTAKIKTGLSDWGNNSFIENLQILIDSCIREADLNYIGRITLFRTCVQAVMDRLTIHDYWKKESSQINTDIVKPIFILGLPRTGTTLLQNLLACDANIRPLYYWEQAQVSSPPTPESILDNPIIHQAEKDVRRLKWVASDFISAHEVNPRGVEECNGLMNREFVNILHFMFRNVPTYMDYLLNIDMSDMYRFHKIQLQYFGKNFTDKKWMLKAPAHLAFLPFLFKIYPDAIILHMHRDPIHSVPSMCSLAAISRSLMSNTVDVGLISKQWPELMQKIMKKSIHQRENLADKKIVDIQYQQLIEDPLRMVRDIYKIFEMDYSTEFENKMKLWLKNSKKRRKKNPHVYSIEQFGLTKQQIQKMFSDYYDRYNEFI